VISEIAKLRLQGKLAMEEIPVEEEDDSLLEAINSLAEKIDGISAVPVDLSSVTDLLRDVVAIQKQMAQKRNFRHKVTYNSAGDVALIETTEV
jgi:hypothetical protein